MPILGTIASQVPANLPTNSFESIATARVVGGSDTVTFDSIPQTYKHLQIRSYGKSGSNSGQKVEAYTFNINNNGWGSTDAGAHYLQGNGSTVGSDVVVSGGYAYLYNCVGRNGAWGSSIIDILDYSTTSKYKVFRAIGGADANGSGNVGLSSYIWLRTQAITKLIISPNGNGFSDGSIVALYGIKG